MENGVPQRDRLAYPKRTCELDPIHLGLIASFSSPLSVIVMFSSEYQKANYSSSSFDIGDDSDDALLMPTPKRRKHTWKLVAVVSTLFLVFVTCLAISLFWIHTIVILPEKAGTAPLHFAANNHRQFDLNSTLGFSKVFVINLDSRPDRRAEMAILGQEYHIDFDFVPGKVGEIPASENASNHRLKSELGCHRAHTDVWTRIVEDKVPSALILEDDIDFDEEVRLQLGLFQEPLATFLAYDRQTKLPFEGKDPWNVPQWDLLWLGSCQEKAWKGKQRDEYLAYKDHTLVGPGEENHRPGIWKTLQDLNITYPQDDALAYNRSRIIQRANSAMCTGGYALSHRGAMKLLYNVMHSRWEPVDNTMSTLAHEGKIDAYTVTPPIISQSRFSFDGVRDSDIKFPLPKDWKSSRLPGKEGASLSVKNSAKAGLASKMGGV